jgi:hypothetical protein
MKLTYQSLLQLQAALAVFDGEMVPIRDKANDVIGMERKPCAVSIDTALRVAKIAAAIKPHVDRITDLRTRLVATATGGKGKIENDDPKFGGVHETLAVELVVEVEIEMPTIRYDNIKDVKCAPSVLAALMPILTDLPKD